MIPNTQTLERLSSLELRRYAGETDIFSSEDRELYERLMTSPVRVNMTAERVFCEDRLYDICLRLQGDYATFAGARTKAIVELSRDDHSLGWNKITVLFDGVYIGEPEDLHNFRRDRNVRPLYPTKGFGEKIADVEFMDSGN